MYDVVVIEDEYWTLLGILKTFKWEEYGFRVVGKFDDAQEAIDFIFKNEPHVIITDIRMPDMTGLELIAKLRRSKVTSKMMILSAYADFAYAQEAIKNDVFEYCLKPIVQKDADAVLGRLKAALDLEYGKINENLQIVDTKVDNTNFLKMINFINENYNIKLQLNELAEKYNLNNNYCCLLFKKNFSCSFSEYILNIRMKEAAKLLKNTQMSIDDIAEKVGFTDYFYFNKVFKKFYDITPYKYRNKNKLK